MNIYKAIYKKIKNFDTIVIARHVGPDPDALASSLALRDVILNTFPKKHVYTVGTPTSHFSFLGTLDKIDEDIYENALLIVTDTPDKKRVDGVDVDRFKYKIKIDHHPFIEKFCDLEWIDDKASSASQMIIELIFNTKLHFTKETAEKLYIGIVADTERFMHKYTTFKTFDLVSKMLKKTNINFTSLYENLYNKPLKEIKFQGFIANNLKITENGVGYFYVTDDILKEYEIDSSTAKNMVSSLHYINELLVWVIFCQDTSSGLIKGSIRSRGPVINDVASKFNGGGHIYASGVRFTEEENIKLLVEALDEVCKEYKDH